MCNLDLNGVNDLVVAHCTSCHGDQKHSSCLKVMQQTKNVDYQYLTLNLKCDLDLGGSDLIVALCTSSHNGYYLCQVILNTFKQFKNYS